MLASKDTCPHQMGWQTATGQMDTEQMEALFPKAFEAVGTDDFALQNFCLRKAGLSLSENCRCQEQ